MTHDIWTARCDGCNHQHHLKDIFRRFIGRRRFTRIIYVCRGCIKLLYCVDGSFGEVEDR